MGDGLVRPELVVHLFFPSNGEGARSAYAGMLAIWAACRDRFDLTRPVLPNAPNAPGPWEDTRDGGPVAAAEGEAGQIILRRHRDVLCLSAVLYGPWAHVRTLWQDTIRDLTPAELTGEARLYLAYAPGDAPPTPASAEAAVADLGGPPVLGRAQTTSGGFAACEVGDGADGRCLRELVVLAAESDEPALSAWVWSEGTSLPPLARFLSNIALLRRHLRVWDDSASVRALRGRLDGAVRRAIADLPPDEGTARSPAEDVLVENSARLTRLLVEEAGAVFHATRLKEMLRAGEAAHANLAALLGRDFTTAEPLTPFGGDRELSLWFRERLQDDSAYFEASLERAREVRALLDLYVRRLVLQQEERTRWWQEQINYAQLAVVAAIAVTLTAIQSLGYSVPLRADLKPAVAALIGAGTLVAASSVVREAPDGRRGGAWLRPIGAAASAASAVWLLAVLLGGAPVLTIAVSTGAFLITLAAFARPLTIRRPR
ncbi:CATRA conflict system CASPASE/TPR repeat-associated protein [Herbidospora cretacea]|uniref:CATRA conflict system CASPASE/TPR repeat-associated protein n=1 Tax=Herbidospora cretacea TaxID=28444 RepID=UPI000774D761|nr:CATRA conflict system CASPASE/TPR repeat-associated protein [Herbidospora cretacea]